MGVLIGIDQSLEDARPKVTDELLLHREAAEEEDGVAEGGGRARPQLDDTREEVGRRRRGVGRRIRGARSPLGAD